MFLIFYCNNLDVLLSQTKGHLFRFNGTVNLKVRGNKKKIAYCTQTTRFCLGNFIRSLIGDGIFLVYMAKFVLLFQFLFLIFNSTNLAILLSQAKGQLIRFSGTANLKVFHSYLLISLSSNSPKEFRNLYNTSWNHKHLNATFYLLLFLSFNPQEQFCNPSNKT